MTDLYRNVCVRRCIKCCIASCGAVIFRVYLDCNTVIGDSTSHISNSPLELAALELRMFGATICDTLTSHVSHVIVYTGSVCSVYPSYQLSTLRWLCLVNYNLLLVKPPCNYGPSYVQSVGTCANRYH